MRTTQQTFQTDTSIGLFSVDVHISIEPCHTSRPFFVLGNFSDCVTSPKQTRSFIGQFLTKNITGEVLQSVNSIIEFSCASHLSPSPLQDILEVLEVLEEKLATIVSSPLSVAKLYIVEELRFNTVSRRASDTNNFNCKAATPSSQVDNQSRSSSSSFYSLIKCENK